MKKEKELDLIPFKEQLQIVQTGKDKHGNYFESYGKMNAACWIGEHSGLLINEIERLRKELNGL